MAIDSYMKKLTKLGVSEKSKLDVQNLKMNLKFHYSTSSVKKNTHKKLFDTNPNT